MPKESLHHPLSGLSLTHAMTMTGSAPHPLPPHSRFLFSGVRVTRLYNRNLHPLKYLSCPDIFWVTRNVSLPTCCCAISPLVICRTSFSVSVVDSVVAAFPWAYQCHSACFWLLVRGGVAPSLFKLSPNHCRQQLGQQLTLYCQLDQQFGLKQQLLGYNLTLTPT